MLIDKTIILYIIILSQNIDKKYTYMVYTMIIFWLIKFDFMFYYV